MFLISTDGRADDRGYLLVPFHTRLLEERASYFWPRPPMGRKNGVMGHTIRGSSLQ